MASSAAGGVGRTESDALIAGFRLSPGTIAAINAVATACAADDHVCFRVTGDDESEVPADTLQACSSSRARYGHREDFVFLAGSVGGL